jgi:tetratricopeptide (TPR) repeat protein
MASKITNKNIVVGADKVSKHVISRLAAHTNIYVLVIAIVLIVGGVILGASQHSHNQSKGAKLTSETDFMNDALQKKDYTLALDHAKKALAKDPHTVDTILAVANIDKKLNPNEAKQYYKQALNEFKKQDNPDINGKPATTYWAAAGLAEQAGETNQAKQYYQEVIKAAQPTDAYNQGYDQSIAAQSAAALKRLQ